MCQKSLITVYRSISPSCFSCDLKNRKTKNLRDIYGQNLILPGHATWKIEGRDTVINIEKFST